VLGDTAIVPRGNLIQPPPNQFTHELRKPQAYYYARAEGAARPDGGSFRRDQGRVDDPRRWPVLPGGRRARVICGDRVRKPAAHLTMKKLSNRALRTDPVDGDEDGDEITVTKPVIDFVTEYPSPVSRHPQSSPASRHGRFWMAIIP